MWRSTSIDFGAKLIARIHGEAPSVRIRFVQKMIVSGFSAALALARASDLIAIVPERHTENLRAGMHSFSLPISIPEFTVSMLWHPRMDADSAHQWLRGCVLDCTNSVR